MADKQVRPIRRGFIVTILIVIVGVGAVYAGYSGWRHYQSALDDSFQQALLIRDIDRVSLLGNVLTLLDDGEQDKAKQLLEFHLQTALRHVDADAASGLAADSVALPNLKLGVSRAQQYAQQQGMSGDVTQRAERLHVALDAR